MNLEDYKRALSSDSLTEATGILIHMLAIELHSGQKDKLGGPYILHVERVAGNFPNDSPEYLVALLHDTVEDTEITIDNLRYLGLSESVLEAVDAITHRIHEPLVEYYARIKCNPLATKVKLADIVDNLRSSRMQKLPKETQVRLTRKYRRALKVLQDSPKAQISTWSKMTGFKLRGIAR